MNAGILVIGASRAGTGTGAALARAAEMPLQVWNRRPCEAADLVGDEDLGSALKSCRVAIFAVSDDALSELVEKAARLLEKAKTKAETGPQHVIHLSGATEVAVLEAFAPRGSGRGQVTLGALHPLRTFSRVEADPEALAGVTCVLDGEEALVSLLTQWCERAGGHPTGLRAGERARYHAAAALASNAVVALLAESERQMKIAGLDEEAARRGLLRLARGALQEVPEAGLGLALTGPIVRGDLEVVARHLQVHAGDRRRDRLYRDLADLTLDLAESAERLDSQKIAAMRALLRDDED